MSRSARTARQVELEAGRMMGDPEKAVEYLEKGLKFGPNNPLLRALSEQTGGAFAPTAVRP